MTQRIPTPVQTADRVAGFEESVIREMTRIARRHNALNLGQGIPDFPPPDRIKELAIEYITKNNNQYPFTWGTQRLRDAIAAKHKQFYNQHFEPETDIVVCCGSSEAMLSTFLALVNPGDEIIIFEPIYENYLPDTALVSAKPVIVPLTLQGDDWYFDESTLRRAFTDKTKAIIINTPNNPTGKIFSRAELALIAELCQKHNTLVFTDEIYEHMVYDSLEHLPPGVIPGLEDRTVTISGYSKTFAITGWRVGYAAGPGYLIDAIRKVHDYATIGAPTPFQLAVAQYLMETLDNPQFYADLARDYQQRRDTIVEILWESGFIVSPPRGAYYMFADISGLTDESSFEFAKRLIAEAGVATVPGSSFYRKGAENAERYTRFAFPKKPETFAEARQRLQAWRTR